MTATPQALSMADAFGRVVVTSMQAASMFEKLADMMRDSDPELAAAFDSAAEGLREL